MSLQPSAQGIASLYRGNPQPLQQSIQKEQQAKPSLPPDLQKMLALQIVTNEKDSATAQKAMDQLQQMGGQGGKPPTVMASLQQQAAQKLQAQAVQAQQKQQGIQALMQRAPAAGVPEGTPQPEMQPEAQGIDQLPAEFDMAEGGIVSFSKGGDSGEYETPYDRMNRKNRGELTEEERKEEEARAALIAQIPGGGPTVQGGERAEGSNLSRNVKNTLMALPGASAARALSGSLGASRGVAAGLTALTERKEPTEPPAAPAPKAVDNRAALNRADAALRSAPAEAPQPPARDLAALARQKEQAARPPAAASVARAAPMVAPTAAPVAESDAMKLQKARLTASPEASRAADVAEYRQMVGAPDTAQHDRLIAELEKRKQSLAPKQGFEGLMEYLSQVSANSQPGRGSFASGAAGARGMEALNKERALQQFELSKQAIEVSQKKLDTVRAYAEKTYGIGKTAFDKVYKDQFDAAKEIVKDESAARQLAQQNALKVLELNQQATLRREEMRSNEKVAGMRASGAGVGDRQQLAELKALQTSLKDQLKDNRMIGKAGDPLRAQLAQVNMAVAQMAGLSTMGAAPGAAGPGGIPPDVQALLNKYGGK
jgi:hypothetical protein